MPRRKPQAAYGDTSRRRMDYHEAGHAVADFHANFVVYSVTIEPTEEFLGLTDSVFEHDLINESDIPQTRRDVRALALAELAGTLVETCATGGLSIDRESSEYKQAGYLARKWRFSLRAVEQATPRLSKQDWPEVEVVAQALCAEKTLDRARLEALLAKRR
jgi:hypothetical protein